MICVHLFPAMMMTELRCSYGVRIPTYFVATDFTCSPGVGDLQVDGLCIPHRDLIPEFVTAGLPQERLFPTGIPVGQQFLHPESREEARRALDLPVDGRILTLACGSMGAGPLRTTAQKVAELMGPEDLLVTICGSNHRMYQQMQSDFFRPVDRVRVLGYTHEMFRYMYASDLLLTKAGGLTTAEAVAAGLADYYKDAATVKVHALNEPLPENGLYSNAMAGTDRMELYLTVNAAGDQMMLVSLFDNLGKGSSGAAVQCMNLMLGLPETEGLE